MAPKTASKTPAGATPKRQKKVMTLQEKVELLNKLREGMSFAAVGRLYNVNESTVRTIKKKEKDICDAVSASAPRSAKHVSQVREKAMVKMENALFLWIEDQHRKGVVVDSILIREKAKSLHTRFTPAAKEPVPSTSAATPTPETPQTPPTPFQTSKGWFDNFKRRFGLKNVKMTGEAVSADTMAAKTFPAESKAILEEQGYKPEQVWNMDETGLFWKKTPQRTFIAQEERRAPGFKAAKDRCTVLFCGNAAGHLIRPGFIYKSKKPRAFKHRDMSLLPVFWMYNKKAWTTSDLFLNWFHHCFLPEVERYLHQKGLEFKILLILGNAPGHPQPVEVLHEKVQVLFLPPNTTALIQPMDQGVIKTFKANYSKRVMARLHSALDHDQNLDVLHHRRGGEKDPGTVEESGC
ncbi:tigger transposable element-derived protein 1-like [Homarus americanus]|uniref:tigger transposable element-derived protein 1-like n=1 Tax=Homarus americanus TaxID=6706 RepID=UPI001C44CA31|nr:tigger transposable element-derived protein 1-like [Homarus americanus]